MLVYRISLPDGTLLDSGSIRSVTLTEQVNDQEDLCPGAACAACAEIELWAPANGLSIAQGTELILTRLDTGTGAETQAGVFLAEKPEKVSANVIRVTAYDRMTLLDKDLSPWLREQQGSFPMALADFVRAVCTQCGVALADGALTDLPNGTYGIQAFYADGLTGRQLIRWAAQAACRFARMTPEGRLEFAWYTSGKAAGIGPGNLRLTAAVRLAGAILRTAEGEVWRFGEEQAGYLSGMLRYKEYVTAPIDKVQIRQSEEDVGVIYPPEETGTNALVLQGNLLLTTSAADDLRPVAQAVFEEMGDIGYTPLSVAVQAGDNLPRPGTILTVTDAYGRTMQTCVMTRTISGQRCTLESTGHPRRDSTDAVNRQSFSNLKGRMLEISANVEGLKITASELSGGMASLELSVEGLGTRVEQAYTDLTRYVDEQTGQIKDEAVREAVEAASSQIGESLTLYPTKVEMNSAIQQSASEIQLSVSQTLTGYVTDADLKSYPTTAEMNSAIGQSASDISLSVNAKLSQYPTSGEMQDYVDGQTADLPTVSTVQNMIDVGIDGITLTASTSETGSTITLRNNGVQVSSASISFTGLVTFSDLSGSGTAAINGDNITAGTLGSAAGNTQYDLDAGTLRTGRSDSNRVELNDRGIRWYVENSGQTYLTGVLYSKYGATYIGDNSRYTFLGWFSDSEPSFSWSSGGKHSAFVGIAIDQMGTIHCNADKFEIPGRIECSSLAVNGREL